MGCSGYANPKIMPRKPLIVFIEDKFRVAIKTITGFQNRRTDVKLLSAACQLFSTSCISSFSPPPISCAENKYISYFMAMCLRYILSISAPFRFGISCRSSADPTLHFAFIASIHLSTARLREILFSISQAPFIPFSPSPFPTHFQLYIFFSATSLPQIN